MFVKCCSIKQGIWSVTNPSDVPRGRIMLAQGCKTCRDHLGRHLEYIVFLMMYFIASLGCYKDNVCSSKISKINFCMQILEAYQSQGRLFLFCVKNCHLGGHLVRILFLLFIWLLAKCLQLASNFIAYN